jgi:outer membrane protein assembly factor BamB
MKTILFFIITCFFSLSCHKEMAPMPSPPAKPPCERLWIGTQLCDTSPLYKNLKWYTYLSDRDTTRVFSITPRVFGDKVIFSTQFDKYDNDTDILYIRDKYTGTLLKRRKSDCYDANLATSYNNTDFYQNNFVIKAGSKVEVFDMNTYQTQNCFAPEPDHAFNSEFNQIGNNIYLTEYKRGFANYDTLTLVRFNLDTGEKTILSKKGKKDGYRPGLSTPFAFDTKPNGDTVLFFTSVEINFDILGPPKTTLIKYNLKERRIEQETENLINLPNEVGGVGYDKIFGNKCIVATGSKVMAFDINTLTKLWEFKRDVIDGVIFSVIHFENTLIFKTAFNSLYALDVNTGLLKWKRTDVDANIDQFCEVDGIVYFNSDKMYAIRARDGVLLGRWSNPAPWINEDWIYSNSGFDFNWFIGVIVDPVTKNIYTSDGTRAYCFKNPLYP